MNALLVSTRYVYTVCASYQAYQSLASTLAQATPDTTCLYDREKVYTPKGKSDISPAKCSQYPIARFD